MLLRRDMLLSAGVGVFLHTAAASEQAPDIESVVRRLDQIRNPSGSFVFDTEIHEYQGPSMVNAMKLVVFVRPPDTGGELTTIVRIVAPARDAGKLLLRRGNDLWFYDPNGGATIRLSPEQRLIGQVANGDVVATSFHGDYAVSGSNISQIRDGDGNEVQARELNFTKMRKGAVYDKVTMWVSPKTSQPIMAKYFGATEELLKTAFFRRYRLEMSEPRPTEVVIVDAIRTGSATLMRHSAFAAREVPEKWFRREMLSSFPF